MLLVDLKPSRQLGIALLAAHAVAAGLVLPLQLPDSLKVALLVLVASSLAHALRRHARLSSPRSITAIEVRGTETRARTRDGAWHPARVLGTSCVSTRFAVLNLRFPGTRLVQHVVIAPDGAQADAFRRLRVWLRWGWKETD